MNYSFELIPLSELGKIVSGSTPKTHIREYWDGDIPWITPADLTEYNEIFLRKNLRKITKVGFDSCSTTMLPPGSILFSSRAPIGHCAVTTFPLCTNQGFKSIIPDPKKLDSVYGYFALRYFTSDLIAKGRGATFAELNKEIVENFRIPVPPINEQKRIAAIAQKCDRIRRIHRSSQRISSDYLQSVFLEMFGDPAINSKGWKIGTLEDVIISAKDGPHVSPNYLNEGIPFLSTRNIRKGEIIWEDLKFISSEDAEEFWKRGKPERGDILYTKGGTTGLAKVVD